MTPSMDRAINETNRRRKIQMEFNEIHNITPMTIKKKISGGVIDVLRGNKTSKSKAKLGDLITLTASNIDEEIDKLKKEMKKASKDLRFEDAANIRDEIKRLTELRMIV
jgi:excinuclease ABC subunit B